MTLSQVASSVLFYPWSLVAFTIPEVRSVRGHTYIHVYPHTYIHSIHLNEVGPLPHLLIWTFVVFALTDTSISSYILVHTYI